MLEADEFALKRLELKLTNELGKTNLAKIYKEAEEVLIEQIYQKLKISTAKE